MSENTNIEWCDHIDPNPTGRVLGAYKVAARKTGCTVDEWMENRRRGKKWCFGCRGWKAALNFTADRSRSGGLTSRCRPCMSEASTASRYGMSISDLREFRRKHENKCCICSSDELTVVDHNHQTGLVRGLLCPSCNSAIGLLKEDPLLFSAAVKYLEKHRG